MHTSEEYDYIVIGAGIAGLSAAYHLGKDGYRVLVLEATDGKECASFASTAEMNHDPDAKWEKIIENFGVDGATLLWKLGADGMDTLSEFAHQTGEPHFMTERLPAYQYSYTRKDTELLRDKYEFYTSIGAHVSFEEEGSAIHQNFHAVLTTHGEGVTNNQMLLATLVHGIREQGSTILHDTRVVTLAEHGVVTEDGTGYSATRTIIATGDGKGLLSEAMDIECKRTFVLSYDKEGLPELFKNSVMWDTDSPYHYVRSFAGNRLWVGGEDVYDSDYMPSTEEDEKKYAALDAYAHTVLGIDDSYTRQAAWSGLFYPAKRGLPYIGEIPGTTRIASIGFGGTGIITSFMSGYLLAAWRRGEMLEYKELFSLDWD